MNALKLIFAGTPAFALLPLKKLIESHHTIVAVYTQPDRPAGRGLKLTESPVKTFAKSQGLPVFEPTSFKDEEALSQLAAFKADAMIVAAYGLLLPEKVLAMPRLGCINIHPSLLPRWRGAAPLARTILAGDLVSGVSIMQMDKGLDTGNVLYQTHYTLKSNETTQSLHDELSKQGAEALLKTLELLTEDKIIPKAQDHNKATYAHKLKKEEAKINWQESAIEIDRKIRGFNPWPIAFTEWKATLIRIFEAKIISSATEETAGRIIGFSREGLDVATKKGVLRLLQLQWPGARVLIIADFYNAKREVMKIGDLFT